MNLPMTGGCLCGALKYEITSEPLGAGNCHCRTCQKSIGAPYFSALFVLFSAFKISGNYKEYATVADSGNVVHRAFCPECGTSVFGRNSANDKFRPVNAITLDHPEQYRPTMDFWTKSAQHWDYMDPALEKFEENFTHL